MLKFLLSSSLALSVSRATAQLCNLILIFAATYWLQPGDFGTFAIASAISVLLFWLAEAGWKEFVISEREDDEARSVAMWCAVGAGTMGASLVAAVCIIIQPFAARSAIPSLIITLAATAPFIGWNSVQQAILIRRRQLTQLAWIVIASEILGLVLGLAALKAGAGLYSLAGSKILQTLVAFAGLTLATRWLPTLTFEREVVAVLGRYWRALILTRLFDYTKAYGVELYIGFFIGTAPLGVYRLGSRILASVSELIVEPARTVIWAELARIKASGGALKAANALILQRLYLIVTPVFVGLALVAHDLIRLIFPPQWHEAADILSILSVTSALSAQFGIAAAPIFSLLQEPRWLAHIGWLTAGTTLISLFALAPFGIHWAAFAPLASFLLSLPLLIYAFGRVGGVSIPMLAKGAALAAVASAIMVALVLVVRSLAEAAGLPLAVRLILTIVTGASAYALALYGLCGDCRRMLHDRLGQTAGQDRSSTHPQTEEAAARTARPAIDGGLRILSIPARRNRNGNPFTSILAETLEQDGHRVDDIHGGTLLARHYDALLLHWPQNFATLSTARSVQKVALLYLMLAFLRLRGTKIVWLAHDIQPMLANNTGLASWHMKRFVSWIDGVIFMSHSSRRAAFDFYPLLRQKRSYLSFHPMPLIEPSASQRAVTLPALPPAQLGFIGDIRPSKGLLEFLMLCVESDIPLNLRVVGQCTGDYPEEPIARAIETLSRFGSVAWIRERPSDAEFEAHLQTMDVVLLPYLTGWNSGVILTALYARRRILANDLPLFREIQSLVGEYWVTIYDPTGPGLIRALREMEECPRRTEDDERLSRFLVGSSWRRCAVGMAGFMSDMLGPEQPTNTTERQMGAEALR